MVTVLKSNLLAKIAITACLMAVFLITTPVLAQTTNSTETPRVPKLQQRLELASREANLKERAENREAKIASKAAMLKVRLQAFKDQKKAQVAERVSANLNKINQKQTQQMLKHLETMSNILDKLEARINQVSKTTIDSSRESIASATAVVSNQAAKDYTITVTSEAKVKQNAQTQRDQLLNDLKSTKQQVIEAKQSVAAAIRTAKSGTFIKEGTVSGQQ